MIVLLLVLLLVLLFAFRYDFLSMYRGKSVRATPVSHKHFPPTSTFYDYNKQRCTYAAPLPLPPSGIELDADEASNYYPHLESLSDIYGRWPQNDLKRWPRGGERDYSKEKPFTEHLAIFDFQDEKAMKEALVYRNMELPFKIRNVPELNSASRKWDDPSYILRGLEEMHFSKAEQGKRAIRGQAVRGSNKNPHRERRRKKEDGRLVHYNVELVKKSGFFTWYDERQVTPWKTSGVPGAKDYVIPNEVLSKSSGADNMLHHAIIKGDLEGKIGEHDDHVYLTLGVGQVVGTDPRERKQQMKDKSFVGRDLPFFVSGENNFIVFDFDQNKGVQCRIGERGVTAAAHFDNGRNMIAMVKGAKRYVLAPPNQCNKMHIVKNKHHPSRRHSLLNFANIEKDHSEEMREAASALAVETILKEGEILYIPSKWFHYITSLQFSAQCNSRSGMSADEESYAATTELYGGNAEIDSCLGWGGRSSSGDKV